MENRQALINLYNDLDSFNSFEDIETAVSLGVAVFWKNEGYSLTFNRGGFLYIINVLNDSCFRIDKSNCKPRDFFSKSLV